MKKCVSVELDEKRVVVIVHLVDMAMPLSCERRLWAGPSCFPVAFFVPDAPPPTARLVVAEARDFVTVFLRGQTTKTEVNKKWHFVLIDSAKM